MQDEGGEPQQHYPGYYGPAQSPEFLRYLIDNTDPILEMQNELEGKEIIIEKDTPILAQVRVPLVNPALRNKIMATLKNYNSKGFTTTNFSTTEIKEILFDVSNAMVDLLELCETFQSQDYKNDPAFLQQYPACLEGTHTQILLITEHSVHAALNRSQNALTLNKVTGVHQSTEIRNPDQQGQRRGWKIPLLK